MHQHTRTIVEFPKGHSFCTGLNEYGDKRIHHKSRAYSFSGNDIAYVTFTHNVTFEGTFDTCRITLDRRCMYEVRCFKYKVTPTIITTGVYTGVHHCNYKEISRETINIRRWEEHYANEILACINAKTDIPVTVLDFFPLDEYYVSQRIEQMIRTEAEESKQETTRVVIEHGSRRAVNKEALQLMLLGLSGVTDLTYAGIPLKMRVDYVPHTTCPQYFVDTCIGKNKYTISAVKELTDYWNVHAVQHENCQSSIEEGHSKCMGSVRVCLSKSLEKERCTHANLSTVMCNMIGVVFGKEMSKEPPTQIVLAA